MADIQKQIDMIELEIQKVSKDLEGKTIEQKEVLFEKKNQLINNKLKLINILYDFNKIIKDKENNEIEIKENKPIKRKKSSIDSNDDKNKEEIVKYLKGPNGETKQIISKISKKKDLSQKKEGIKKKKKTEEQINNAKNINIVSENKKEKMKKEAHSNIEEISIKEIDSKKDNSLVEEEEPKDSQILKIKKEHNSNKQSKKINKKINFKEKITEDKIIDTFL